MKNDKIRHSQTSDRNLTDFHAENEDGLQDREIEEFLRAPFGYTDEQLLKELAAAEEAADIDFPDNSARMYQALMERKSREEKSAGDRLMEETGTGPDIAIDKETVAEETEPANKFEKKTVVRLSKGRMLLVAVIAAVFVGMLGMTAIGEKNYFFRIREEEKGFVLNNDSNISDLASLEEAYIIAEENMDIPLMKMGYVPKDMVFLDLNIIKNKVLFNFDYNGETIYFIQEQSYAGISIGVGSDTKKENIDKVYNKILHEEIAINEYQGEDKKKFLYALIVHENAWYYIMGDLPVDEMKKIVEFWSFY